MAGREDNSKNNLFFVCSLIEYVSRKTKNHRDVVVNKIGYNNLQHILDLADVYHSENINKLTSEIIDKYNITNGTFDNIATAKYSIPTHWDIGKVYKRLVSSVSEKTKKSFIQTLIDVYNSWLSRKIEDINSNVYYENPEYIYQSYLNGKLL